MTTTEQMAADLNLVVTHTLLDADGLYGMPANGPFVLQVAQDKFLQPRHLATVLGWVLNHLRWTARFRSLTDDETLIYAAALRVAEVISMFDTLARLGQALAAKDYHEARAHWLHLAPWHALLIGASPDAAHLNVLLQDLTQPAIH
jgi:hypothetical protein